MAILSDKDIIEYLNHKSLPSLYLSTMNLYVLMCVYLSLTALFSFFLRSPGHNEIIPT